MTETKVALSPLYYIEAIELLVSWVQQARDGIFSDDFTEESCKETCNTKHKCIVCMTETFLQAVKADA